MMIVSEIDDDKLPVLKICGKPFEPE
jgi:hypothetical protein